MADTWQTAYVALGSNLGDSHSFLEAATTHIDALACTAVRLRSHRLHSKALTLRGRFERQPDYLNQVLAVETQLPVLDFFDALCAIELKLGRQRGEKWAPRTIDIDLLLFGKMTLSTPRLTIPHPEMQRRRFVLEPLREIAPGLVFPNGWTPDTALAALPADSP
jgi:2-amino-4-hydroxy-6-hydroxymethyldihydropteridine diphosphokinase